MSKSPEQVWKQNTFIFIISQLVSLLGSSLVQYSITWYITLKTQSGIYATIAIVCGFLPTFILSPFAGVWVDRYNRKKLIIFADAVIAISTLALAISFLLGFDFIWLLFIALGVRGLGTAIQTPCVNAVIPDMVPSAQLTRVNGINGSVQAITNLISPVLSGILLSFSTIESIFFIDVFTALIAISILIFVLKLPCKRSSEDHVSMSYFKELKAGFLYIRSQHYLLALFSYFTVMYIMAAPILFLTPLQTVRVFGGDVWLLTAIELASGIGMVVGGVIIAIGGGLKNCVHSIFIFMLVMGISVILLGFPSYFWLYLAIMGTFCIMFTMTSTVTTTMLQKKISADYIGRVFGVFTMLSSSLLPLGMVIFGPLADVLPIESLLIISGIGILIVAIAIIATPSLRTAGIQIETSLE